MICYHGLCLSERYWFWLVWILRYGCLSGSEDLGSSEEEGKDWDELEAEAKRGNNWPALRLAA